MTALETQSTPGAAVEVTDVTKHFGAVRALDGVSFTVAPGEVFGLLGPNGAGKSTMIRILTGRAKPTGGRAEVLGHELPRELEAVRTQINLVAETPNVYERMTARENLQLFCRLYGVPSARVLQTLEQVRLDDVAERKVKTFSTGMRQRLLLARALINRPKVLFLDEPTRGLDPRSARELHDTVRMLAAGGVTVFLTTHDMTEADELCRRVAFLTEGRIAALDTPRALKLGLRHDRPGVDLVLDDGSDEALRLDAPPDVARLQALLGAGRVRSVHSREPTLAEVFIDLTGRSLEHDPARPEEQR